MQQRLLEELKNRRSQGLQRRLEIPLVESMDWRGEKASEQKMMELEKEENLEEEALSQLLGLLDLIPQEIQVKSVRKHLESLSI